MDLYEAMAARHSVRSFKEEKINEEAKKSLENVITECSSESGLTIKLICDEPKAFDSMMAHYGKFKNCRNYIAIAGKSGCDEAVGYYGEKIVLTAQTLGLNTCWVALTYSKGAVPLKPKSNEKIQIIIAIGYGETQGITHKNKPVESLCKANGEMPQWFKNGMEGALLAPTAMNQQKFIITQNGDTASIKAGTGFYSKIDLGIVKFNFELAAGKDNFKWA